MESEKDIVCFWLNKNGFSTIKDIKAGRNKEIDILAMKVEGNKVKKLQHVEVICSISSVFEREAKKYIERKFTDKAIAKKIKSYMKSIGINSYEKVVILGTLAQQKSNKITDLLQKENFVVHKFETVLLEVMRSLDKQNYSATIRTIQLLKYILLSNPEMTANLLNNTLNQNTRERFVKSLIEQKKVKRIFAKKTFNKAVLEALKESPLRRPEFLVDALDTLMTTRSKKKLIRILTEKKTRKKIARKDKPLQHFLH